MNRSPSYPIRSAERVLDELEISSPDDLQLIEQIAWARGALVRYEKLEGSEARLTAVGNPAIIIISTLMSNPPRKRFSIAHELGHFEMHRHRTSLSLCTKEKIDDWWSGKSNKETSYNQEQEANVFASALLLPERFFAPYCVDQEPSLYYISELADRFVVSLTATSLRYLYFSDEPLAIVFSQNNRISWFQETKSFGELRDELGFFIDVRSRLDASTRAAFYFRSGGIPPGMKSVKASSWFTAGDYNEGANIKEHSIAMPSYNAVLTLLWIDDVIDDEY
jgi:Zn-dependent peptidase ImmA (M78 family)